MNPDDLRRADAIEVVVGQGAKPGGGGMLLGQKINDRVAGMRDLPAGIDQRSACRHPDWTGPDDLEIKILELREITGWEKPVYIKVGGARPYFDTTLAVKAGADVVVVDGMQGGTAATQDVFIEHVGQPTSPASARRCKRCRIRHASTGAACRVGGIRNGADAPMHYAWRTPSIGSAAMIAIGDNDSLGSGIMRWHNGKFMMTGTRVMTRQVQQHRIRWMARLIQLRADTVCATI